MTALVFRHVPFEHLGLIAPALENRGCAIRYVDVYKGEEIPADWQAASGLIFMGGPMSANDRLPFLRQELALIERAVAAGYPVLGVCLGSQLIAKALGARVYRNRVREIGWAPVYWREEAQRDPLFGGLTAPETVFHWHGETFELPAGAQWLAWSDACPHQAFRAGPAYGLQFHLEVTPAMIEGWCAEDANSGDVRELSAPIDPHAHAARLAQLAALVFGRWAARIGLPAAPPLPGGAPARPKW